ncbi:MAG: flagellar hook basal-body protein [Planctomycetes bacterium]|nr:flagellar hook basal-body protein [Planctomycetota bacterium]
MSGPTNVNAAGMGALGRQYEAIAHNLANASTPGYKRLFCTLVGGAPGAAGGPGGAAAPILGESSVDFTQGAIVHTGRPLDLALHGKGFFVVETPQGERYTRNGTFQTSAQGQLVDSGGRTVAGDAGPIVIPRTAGEAGVSVAADGRIQAGSTVLGKLRIVEFEKPEALVPAGEGSFRAPRTAAPLPAAKTTVQQGFQEASNVSVVNELVGLITVTRLYEANANIMNKRGEMAKTIIQVAMGNV